VVGDGQGLGGFVGADVISSGAAASKMSFSVSWRWRSFSRASDALRHQLAHEDFAVGVEAVDDDVQDCLTSAWNSRRWDAEVLMVLGAASMGIGRDLSKGSHALLPPSPTSTDILSMRLGQHLQAHPELTPPRCSLIAQPV